MNEKKSLRQTLILMDFSEVMKDRDFVPNRVICILEITLVILKEISR